mmetsp:Transcript_43930/g.99274  ORF Transcript_43930/g.99274 Transcript_43930/m.99274 type:complete len:206 (+) Transcript_43930:308-925(+)
MCFEDTGHVATVWPSRVRLDPTGPDSMGIALCYHICGPIAAQPIHRHGECESRLVLSMIASVGPGRADAGLGTGARHPVLHHLRAHAAAARIGQRAPGAESAVTIVDFGLSVLEATFGPSPLLVKVFIHARVGGKSRGAIAQYATLRGGRGDGAIEKIFRDGRWRWSLEPHCRVEPNDACHIELLAQSVYYDGLPRIASEGTHMG